MNWIWTGAYHAFAMFWALVLGCGISTARRVRPERQDNWRCQKMRLRFGSSYVWLLR